MQEESNFWFLVPENKDNVIWSGRREVKGAKGIFWTQLDHLGVMDGQTDGRSVVQEFPIVVSGWGIYSIGCIQSNVPKYKTASKQSIYKAIKEIKEKVSIPELWTVGAVQ